MKTYYKLTNQKMQTYNDFQWKLGEWQEAAGDISKGLCSNAWLHCYDSPLLAILHNPIHANIHNPRLFEVNVSGETKNDRGIKRGFRKMRIIKEIPLSKITKNQKIAYSILCAKKVYKNKKWNLWANNWLNRKNRNAAAAAAAAYAADAAAAAYAAYAAADAADAAADAAYAAADAAYAAADAAYAAADTAVLNLVEIAEQAMKY